MIQPNLFSEEQNEMRIEKGRKRKRKLTKYQFDKMKPGDSFYYDSSRNTAIIAFGSYLSMGKYKTEKEEVFDADGKLIKSGWRFHLLKKE